MMETFIKTFCGLMTLETVNFYAFCTDFMGRSEFKI